ncbi:MAG: hypothetical protein NTV51_08140, partial [Verrucomicrobia bacterium]|nr:hypothetical protein [Verrucomicrobiota bacterium]
MRSFAALSRLVLITAALFGGVVSGMAATYTFNPNDGNGDPDDLDDLDHYKYYVWGFKNFTVPVGEVVTGATLTITQINNWDAAENNGQNWLNMWLLDRAVSNSYAGNYNAGSTADGYVMSYADGDGGLDIFAQSSWQSSIARTKIATYTDYNGGTNGDYVNLSYTFSPTLLTALNSYITNGNNFALGFDPDCHYWNTGIQFQLTTGAPPQNNHYVPEGGVTA